MTGPEPARRPARRRRSRSSGAPADGADGPPAVVPPANPSPPPAPAKKPRRSHADPAADHTLRSLVSSRPTQLSPTVAMRAREVAVPTADDLAAAAQDLVLIRRNYIPPTPLKPGRRTGRGGGRRGHGRSDPEPRQDGSSGADGSNS